jgi:transmembrane sensor
MIETESADQIDEAAFAWMARLDRCGADPAVEAELAAWLEQDERRRGAFLRAQAIWGKLDRASQRASPRASLAERAQGRAIRIDRRRALTGGAAALAAGAAGVWALQREPLYATSIGQVSRVPLADGSGVVLNTDSRVRVALRDHERRVQLTQGEAWFQVAKDPTRPFVVEAGRARVRAVGTAFSVRRLDDGAEVMVSEGVVEAWLAGEGQSRKRLIAGERARVLEGQPILVEASAVTAVERKLAWREKRIELDGETLGEAVAEFNRFNRRRIVLADSRLAGRRLYGVFHADDPESFARSVSLSLGVDAGFEPDRITIGGPQSL